MKLILGLMSINNNSLSTLSDGQKCVQIASDGSVKNKEGTAAWAIWYKKHKLISSQLAVDGIHVDSHRAELTGICGALTFLWLLQQNNVQLQFNFYCDCESAIKIIQKNTRNTPASYDKKHSDLMLH